MATKEGVNRLRGSFLTLFLFFSSAGFGADNSFVAFGPQNSIRTDGGPDTFTSSFPVQNPSIPYTLQIYNGGIESNFQPILNPISSAAVTLNGSQVAGPSDFNQQVSLIERAVTLLTDNELVVELQSGPGAGIAVQIVGIDNDPPTIAGQVAPPPNPAGWHNTDVEVSFLCEDGTSGIASCAEPVTITTEGAGQDVSGTAVDRAGNTATATVTLNIDKTPPDLSSAITPPANANGWHNTSVTVGFEATDALSGVDSLTPAVTLTVEGADQLVSGEAIDLAGNSASAQVTVDLDRTAPTVTNLQPGNGSVLDNPRPAMGAIFSDGLSGVDTTAVQVVLDSADVTDQAQVGATGFSLTLATDLTDGSHSLSVAIVDLAGNAASETTTFTIQTIDDGLPPDPATVAPPVDPSVATTLIDSTAFLYTGENPIQTGVAPGTIEAERVAVLRGQVLTRQGTPLRGVTISILDHPEFGETLSRADGFFDLAVNGGGILTVEYAKEGFLPAQRQVAAPWRDYAFLPDVVLIPLDSQVTPIDLTAPVDFQVARGNPVTDDDGTRQATLFFPQGAQAEMVLPDGTIEALTSLSVRATEYTVGENGPEAMPAVLPPQSAYTYAVELSADEAIAAGATEVRFDQPVPFYLENFLGFPVGGIVPTGYYDRALGQWIASRNGQIIEILGITGDLADLDTTGDGLADNGITLGVTDAERQRLAGLYAPGQGLWRVPIDHFTPWDCNWPFGLPLDAEAPLPRACQELGLGGTACDIGNAPLNEPQDDPCEALSSIIECQNQTLRERIPIKGTAFSLNYASDRTLARSNGKAIEIPLSPSSVPESLKQIELLVTVAGQRIEQVFPAEPNQSSTFDWNGQDAYGRVLQGAVTAEISIGYGYDVVYLDPVSFEQSFARASASGATLDVERGRSDGKLVSAYKERLGQWDARGQGLGGWTLSPHHAYDAAGQVLYRGDGTRTSASNIVADDVVHTVAGTGEGAFIGDDVEGPALEVDLFQPSGVTVAPDGTLYIAELIGVVRRLTRGGNIELVAGGLFSPGDVSGDGIPATEVAVNPRDLDLGSDGDLYIADVLNHCIRRVDPDGIMHTVAGICGQGGFSGDGGPAREALLTFPQGIAVASDGGIYVAGNDHRIRHIGPDGIITTIAGTGVPGFGGDGGPATGALLNSPRGVAISPDGGGIFIADTQNQRIRRIGPDGIIATVVGGGAQALLNRPTDLAFDTIGRLYIADLNARVLRVGPDGTVITVAGGNVGFFGDGGPATRAGFRAIEGIAVEPGNGLYIADTFNHVIRRLSLPLPDFLDSEVTVSSMDEDELYQFDAGGRHLRTLDALTGTVRFEFGYDASGRLVAITDGDGNVTSIERDAEGNATAIVGPYGQRTALDLDADGYLSGITDPAGQSYQFTYYAGGLLAALADPRSQVSSFAYDAEGRLIQDSDPAGGFMTLTRDEARGTFMVTKRTTLDRVSTYQVESLPDGSLRRLTIDPSGAVSEVITGTDGGQQLTNPDGSVLTMDYLPDPRWGVTALTSPVSTLRTPSGLIQSSTSQRTVTLADPANPLSLESLTDVNTINGRTYTSTFDAVTGVMTSTSPEGRQAISVLDTRGRVVQSQFDPTLEPTVYSFDVRGRVESIARGSHLISYSFDPFGRRAAMVDSRGAAIQYEYDDANRITVKELPSGRTFEYGYDANGNLTSVTLPSGAVHELAYTPINLNSFYGPPGSTDGDIRTYDLDQALEQLFKPSSRAQDYSYDEGGRPTGVVSPEATVSYSYGDATDRVQTISREPAGGPSQDITFDYDGFLNTGATWDGAANGVFSYAYDNNFFLTGLELDGTSLPITRDNDGHLTGYGPFTYLRTGPAGSLGRIEDGTLALDLTYDSLWRLSNRTHAVSGQAVYAVSLEYENVGHNRLGRIRQKTETLAGTTHVYTYTYDVDGQLTEVRRDGDLVESYAYDVDGNRTAKGAITATYDARGLLTQLGSLSYEFDADGFLTRRGGDSFQYGARGELIEVTLAGGETITYGYDGLGRRVSRGDSAGTIQYLYGDPGSPFRITHVRDRAGDLTTLFYDEAGYLFALEQAGARFYVATDQVGSPRVVIDATGAVVKELDYDSFGTLLVDSNPGFEPVIGYAGGLADAATGLVRFGARDLDSATGRWTGRDPILFDGRQENLYVYVVNDPVNLRDPLGLFCVGGSIYALIGGGGELCVGAKGVSLCAETGFGAGIQTGVSLDSPRRTGSETTLEGEASCLGVGSKAGVRLKDCGEFEPIGEIGVGPFKYGTSGSALETGGPVEQIAEGVLGAGKCGVGGKLAARICGQIGF